MIASARNQFHGRSNAVAAAALNDEVRIEVVSGLMVVATITHGSGAALTGRADLGLRQADVHRH